MILGWLLFLFIAVPIAELALLLKVNEYLHWPNTIALVIITGIVGAFLAKAQGIATLMRIRGDLQSGQIPAPQIMDGVMILVAGALLVTPGLMTDTAGFLLLIPPVRAAIRHHLRKNFEQRIRKGNMYIDIH